MEERATGLEGKEGKQKKEEKNQTAALRERERERAGQAYIGEHVHSVIMDADVRSGV